MEETAFAKLNLALHVRGREPDGYHSIETIFAFTEDGDRLTAAPADALILTLEGPFAGSLSAGSDNLVVRAAEALRARFGVTRGAALTLRKILPIASGIGGGSADAAAALRLLTRLWDLPASIEDLHDLAVPLGADVPACVLSRPARGEGRGDVLTLLDDPSLRGVPVLLVNPGVALATPDVFRGWDGRDRGRLGDALTGRNDLEVPARALVPEIGIVLDALATSPGARVARMSGSGATCFALFETEMLRDAAKARIETAHPGWWLLATRLRV